jgi:hypothetical protein
MGNVTVKKKRRILADFKKSKTQAGKAVFPLVLFLD